MTDKTPEELALNSFLASKTPVERLQITLEDWESYVKGFFAGYEAGRPKWHKTAEQLPQVGRGVPVVVQNEDGYKFLGWDWLRISENWNNYGNRVTQWFDLPTYPLEEP